MITANDLRRGMRVELEGVLYRVEESQHVKRGRGGAFVRAKLKNLEGQQIIRRVFSPTERLKDAFIEERKAQHTYQKGGIFHFMDLETFEEKAIAKETLGPQTNFLKENIEVTLELYEGRIVRLQLPTFVELEVKKAPPGVRGDTVGSANKLIVLESGYSLQAPLFIKEGDLVRIDTRSGRYIGKK